MDSTDRTSIVGSIVTSELFVDTLGARTLAAQADTSRSVLPPLEIQDRIGRNGPEPDDAAVHVWRWNPEALRRMPPARVAMDIPRDSHHLPDEEQQVWDRAGAARVRILPERTNPGSGFLVQYANGRTGETEYAVVTANHVATTDRNHTQLQLADGTCLRAARIDGREYEDVAVFRLRTQDVPQWARDQALSIDPNRTAAMRSQIFVLGFRGFDSDPTLSGGFVGGTSAQSGRLPLDMPLGGGMSGSAVLDGEGNVVGVARSRGDAIQIRDVHNLLTGRITNRRDLT